MARPNLLLSGAHRGKSLCLNDLVDANAPLTCACFKDLTSSSCPCMSGLLITDSGPALVYHPMIIEVLDGSVICSMALWTSGAAGPSGVNAFSWRCLCIAFRSTSNELCSCIAMLADYIFC